MIAALLLVASVGAADIPAIPDAKAFSQLLEAQQSGGKPVVVHFFATWCAPCVKELPRLRPMLRDAEKRGARVALISLDDPHEQNRELPRFLRKLGLDLPTWLLTAPDPEPIAALLDPKWTGGLPATFIVYQGKTVRSFFGPVKRPRNVLDALPKSP